MTLVKVRRAAQIALPHDIREAARLEEGDYLEAEVTESGTILLKPVSIAGREPTPEQQAENSGCRRRGQKLLWQKAQWAACKTRPGTTGDKDSLALSRYQSIRILTARAFLTELGI